VVENGECKTWNSETLIITCIIFHISSVYITHIDIFQSSCYDFIQVAMWEIDWQLL
jgi:hypothetical protein